MSPRGQHTDPLGAGFKWRLRAELDRIRPPYSSPRYLSASRLRIGAWRLAPAALAVAVVSMLGLTAYAATGSPNPAVWTQQIVTRIETNTTTGPSPLPDASDSGSPHGAAPAPPTQRAQPAPSAEPSERPEVTPSPSPEDGSGHGDDGAPAAPTPSPSPYGGDH